MANAYASATKRVVVSAHGIATMIDITASTIREFLTAYASGNYTVVSDKAPPSTDLHKYGISIQSITGESFKFNGMNPVGNNLDRTLPSGLSTGNIPYDFSISMTPQKIDAGADSQEALDELIDSIGEAIEALDESTQPEEVAPVVEPLINMKAPKILENLISKIVA